MIFSENVKNIHDEMEKHHSYKKKRVMCDSARAYHGHYTSSVRKFAQVVGISSKFSSRFLDEYN